jgi:hypothetical protein
MAQGGEADSVHMSLNTNNRYAWMHIYLHRNNVHSIKIQQCLAHSQCTSELIDAIYKAHSGHIQGTFRPHWVHTLPVCGDPTHRQCIAHCSTQAMHCTLQHTGDALHTAAHRHTPCSLTLAADICGCSVLIMQALIRLTSGSHHAGSHQVNFRFSSG